MTSIINFAARHYILFIIISVILVFSLIGWIANNKRKKGSPLKFHSEQLKEDFVMPEGAATNMSLQEAVNNSADENISQVN